MQWPLPSNVIDAHELQKTRVDETHTNAVPHVHGGQVRDDRKCRPEAVRRREEIEHRRDACRNATDFILPSPHFKEI